MCGRFVVARPGLDLIEGLEVDVVGDDLPAPSFNIAPTMRAAIVLDSGKTEPPTRRLEAARFGLVPPWAKDPREGARAFNARAETAEHKPMFRGALAARRAVVPMSGYYEWHTGDAGKVPHYISSPGDEPLLMAGLYEWWKHPAPEGQSPWLLSFAILTTDAAGGLEAIHDRMPLGIDRDMAELWLDPHLENVGDILDAAVDAAPEIAAGLQTRVVSQAVGDVRNDSPELIEARAE